MTGAYFDAIRDGLQGVLDLLLKIALPAAIFLGLLAAAAIAAFAMRGSSPTIDWAGVRHSASRVFAYVGVGLIVVCLWAALKQVQPAAKDYIDWKDSAESQDDPAPDAPPISQSGPVAARMVEKTYRRSLTLPPAFVQRIGVDGLSILSPYLVDPTAANVLKLADSFKRSGRDVQFTRELTREDEEAISFDASDVKIAIRRLQEQAYEVEFSGTYTFTNPTGRPVKARFMFSPPDGGGTIQGLKVEVDGQEASEAGAGMHHQEGATFPGEPEPAPSDLPGSPTPAPSWDESYAKAPPAGMGDMKPRSYGPLPEGVYAWTGQLKAGETRRATVRYTAVGARNWSYDLGSSRRRVKAFNLEAKVDGPVQFLKGGIEPTSRAGNTISWKLKDVVTSQRLALAFPRDVRVRESYLQALATLPATLILFGLGVLVAAWRLRISLWPSQLALGLIVFGFALGASATLANYIGPMTAVFVCPLIGGVVAGGLCDRRSLLAVLPISLLPAASLSPQNTGLWILLLAAVGLAGYMFLPRLVESANGPSE